MGLRLSEDKTLITHIDEGLDFLGWHIQCRRKRGTYRRYVYTYPSHKALTAVTGKVKIRWPLYSLTPLPRPCTRHAGARTGRSRRFVSAVSAAMALLWTTPRSRLSWTRSGKSCEPTP